VFVVVGEEKHVGTQDPSRGASKVRLGTSVKQFLADWGYAWNDNAGIICVDPCR
jgi:Na+-translocating ferredoxin:NAD+ oxidoreductase RnfC subunit